MEKFYDAYRYDERTHMSGGTHWEVEENIKETLTRIDLWNDNYPSCGMPIISNGVCAYVSSGDSHGLIMGSTGSKKTRLFVMPMMNMIAKAGESVICTDPKGELYRRTAGLFAAKGYQVHVLNLRDPQHSCGWNPLYQARWYLNHHQYEKTNSLIDDLAMSLFPPRIGTKADPFWENMSRALFRFLSHMVVDGVKYYRDEEVSFAQFQQLLDHFVVEESDSYDNETNQLVETYPAESRVHQCHKVVSRGSEKTFENVLASYHADTAYLFSNPMLLRLLSCNELDLADIGKRKSALFIIMPDEKTTYHGLVSLLIKRAYEELIGLAQNSPRGEVPVRVNFMLDEFCNLPMIPDMSAMISAARSRKIRFYLVVQSLLQLQEKYGSHANTIRGNCNDWAFLTSREYPLLQELSDLCGVREDTGKPLITVSQLQRLDKEKGETLMMCGRLYPYIAYLADIDDYVFKQMEPPPYPLLSEKKPRPFAPVASSARKQGISYDEFMEELKKIMGDGDAEDND